MVWGYVSVCAVDSWNIWKGSIRAEENMEVSEEHLLHPDNVSVREDLPYFSKTMLNHRLHPSQQQDFTGGESSC